jgi:hypothetical protein
VRARQVLRAQQQRNTLTALQALRRYRVHIEIDS